MDVIVLDGNRYETKADLWSHYMSQIDPNMADGFGCNLDAFNDALSGGPGFPGNKQFVAQNIEKMKRALGEEYVANIIQIIKESEGFRIEFH